MSAGEHTLQLYAENIGRITYGPEILDNSKGLFGSITLSGTEIENWKMIPLAVRECSVGELTFTPQANGGIPCFYKGLFTVETPAETYLDVSGWGMGEVWALCGFLLGTECAAIHTTTGRYIAKGNKLFDRF